MLRGIEIISGPAVEPVTLAEALVQCRVPAGVEDAWLTTAITAARIEAENYQWRAYITQRLAVWLDVPPCFPYRVPRAPLQSVVSMSVYDVDNVEHVVPLTDLIVDTTQEPGRVSFNTGASLPLITTRAINAFRVCVDVGYGATAADVPANIKKAILLLVSYMYENRAGEVAEYPRAFYTLLSDRIYL